MGSVLPFTPVLFGGIEERLVIPLGQTGFLHSLSDNTASSQAVLNVLLDLVGVKVGHEQVVQFALDLFVFGLASQVIP